MGSLAHGLSGVALGWRTELAADLLRAPSTVDFVEVVAEGCLADPAARREAEAIRELWPVVVHGVKLSLGSADGIESDRARRLGALARRLAAPCVTEHVALTRGGRREIGHLTALPFSREAVRVVARNVVAARRHLPDVPLLLENVAWTLRWPGSEMSEGDFYAEVAAATGCGLLLDVSNLHANALNAGVPPAEALRAFPVELAQMLHVAGGTWASGFYFDTHAHPVPEGALDLLPEVFRRAGPVPAVLERDALFPPFEELAAELVRVRAAQRDAGTGAGVERADPPACLQAAPAGGPLPSPPGTSARPAGGPGEPGRVNGVAPGETSLQALQERLAALLTAPEAPAPAACAPFERDDLVRSRSVLFHKRVDEALPLLPRLARGGDEVRRLALSALAGTVRASRGAGIGDALRIAAAAAADARLAGAATLDRLALVARFAAQAGGDRYTARAGPYVKRQRLPGGGVAWAVKGPGRGAPVRLLERRPAAG